MDTTIAINNTVFNINNPKGKLLHAIAKYRPFPIMKRILPDTCMRPKVPICVSDILVVCLTQSTLKFIHLALLGIKIASVLVVLRDILHHCTSENSDLLMRAGRIMEGHNRVSFCFYYNRIQ